MAKNITHIAIPEGKENPSSCIDSRWHNPSYIIPNGQKDLDQCNARKKENSSLWISNSPSYDVSYGEEKSSQYHARSNEFRSKSVFSILDAIIACGNDKDLHSGHRIHADVLEQGLHNKDGYISNALISMYVKCGALEKACHAVSQLPTKNMVSLNALIVSYAQHGLVNEALFFVRLMLDKGLTPDAPTFACVLKACGSIRSIKLGEEIHFEVIRKGLLEKSIILGTALLDMYGKCGAIAKAKDVFDQIPVRDVVSWNAIISMYTHRGLYYEALNNFSQMVDEGFTPDAVTLACILKVCGRIGLLEKGEEIHAEVRKRGLLGENVVLSTTLVDMYAKCGVLIKAQEVFDKLPTRNVISWNVLISGYVQHGLCHQALNCFERMKDESVSPNAFTFASVLHACGTIQSIRKGEEVHAQVSKQCSTGKDIVFDTALVDMYAKCGALGKAQEVFDELPKHDLISWNTLISGYVQHGFSNQALICFRQMRDQGISPNEMTFTSVLKACSSIKCIEMGEEIHTEVRKQGLLESNSVVSTALVDMYAKCDRLSKAQEVFDKLALQSVDSYNALIAGYTQHGFYNEAIKCFEKIQDNDLSPNEITFSCMLKACGSLGLAEKGEEIYFEVSKKGLLRENIFLGGALVDMYAKCGELAKARTVLDALPVRDVVSWTALICGYAQHGFGDEALKCYEQMQAEGVSPSIFTFSCVMKACGSIGSIEKGKAVYEKIVEDGLLEQNNVLGNASIDMYAKCGDLVKAREIFDSLCMWDVFTWNTLMAGYVQHGMGDEALQCFRKMQEEGYCPDTTTFACVLKACGSIRSIKNGEEIHAMILEHHFRGTNTCLVANALLDMYSKCGELIKAQEVFDELFIRDVVSWNSLITGFSQCELDCEALTYFKRMQDEGVTPNAITFSCILKACSSLGFGRKGEEIHATVRKELIHVENSVLLSSSLVAMYAKCGLLMKAQQVFDTLPMRDVISWTALISGYARFNHAKHVLVLFNQMIAEGTLPDLITFIAVLTVCSHASLVEEGQMYFNTMTSVYGLTPTLEHYTCMVDLYSRAGYFDKAMIMIENVLLFGNCVEMWVALLGGCGKWANVDLGKWAFEQLLPLDDTCAATYVYMSNIYAAAGMQEKADIVEAL